MDIKDSYLHGTVGVVKSINVDADKLIYKLADIASTTKTITMPLVTVSTNGLMSSIDKIKLDQSTGLNQAIPYIVGPSTDTTAGTWTGSYTGITSYTDGLTIIYVPAVAGASTTTLNINGLGAKTCYYTGTSKLTTHYAVGTPILLTYSGDSWKRADYNSDSNTYTSAHCTTAAATAAKTASCSNYTLKANSYIHILIRYANTVAGAITLNINSTGAKPIYINGAASSSSNYTLPAGTYIAFYDGTNFYFRTDGTLPGTIEKATNATSANKVANNLVIKLKSGSTEGTDLYTYNGSAAKTLDIKQGSNITLTASANALSIAASDTKVTQTNTTTSASYRVLFSGNANDTTETTTARKSANLLFNPSTGSLSATTFIGNLDGTYINKLTSYTKATAIGSIAATDSLNVALGKLEFKTDFIYNDLFGTDSDEYINKWDEIVEFLDSVKEGTDILDEFVTRKTAQTITGQKNFNTSTNTNPLLISRNGSSTEVIAIGVNDSQAIFEYTNDEKANSYVFKMVNTDTEGSDGSGTNTSQVTFSGSSAGSSVTATTFIGKLNNTLTFSAGAFSAKTYNNSSGVTVNIPTHTSHLTNNSGFLTSLPSHTHNYADIGTVTFTPANSELTPAEVLALTGGWSIKKGSWNYAGNGYIKAGDLGNIDLAGTSVLTFGNSSAYTQLYITAPAHSGHSGKTNEIFFYNDHGSNYDPGWTRVITNRNYTDYINTTNFPGLNKVGTVTSVAIANGGGLSVTGSPITSSGTITITNTGVRSTTINGNYLRVNTNGTNADLTIPYATASSVLNSNSLSTETDITESGVRAYTGSGSSWTGSITSMTYAAILAFGGPSRGWQLWCQRGSGSMHYRNGLDDSSGWNTERILLDSVNYSSYLGYIGTTAVQASSKAQALTGISGITPSANNSYTTGTSSYRWSNVYSVLGNFSGLVNTAGLTTSDAITLSGTTSSTAALKFSRTGASTWNYIIWPGNSDADCKLAFGYSNSSAASYYYMTNASFNAVATNTRSLGTSSIRWSNVYSVLGNYSGNVTGAGFVKSGSSDSYVLLGGGGHKTLSSITASALNATTIVSAKAFNLVNTTWTDTGYTFASLTTGTYAIQVTSGSNLVASGIMSVYKNLSDTAGDEIPLHVYSTAGWRPYLRTYANKLQISSNDASSTSRTVTIKIAQIL